MKFQFLEKLGRLNWEAAKVEIVLLVVLFIVFLIALPEDYPWYGSLKEQARSLVLEGLISSVSILGCFLLSLIAGLKIRKN